MNRAPRVYAVAMWTLTCLFFLRVLGQALVVFFHVASLPPMKEWYSGLIPYPLLLPIQVVILALMSKICVDFSRSRGFFAVPKKAFGRFLLCFSFIYFASMILRYGITMTLYPERRWFGGTIPIFFHFVLAGYLFALGHFHSRRRVS